MARRLPRLALSVALALAAPAAEAVDRRGLLVAYSFEEEGLATGPDTFSIYEHARGRVDLSAEMALSGWASIRIEDAPGDGDFPELQGYFPRRSTGRLFVHFALLVAEPDEELNVALAGPAWFALAPDGIAFWLQLVDGELRHVSDSISKRLLVVRPFVWYAVDLAMDLDAGTYDLRIREEDLSEPVVSLRGVPAAASAPGSAVDKFSFIGDLPASDRSRTVYFVDDVLVGVDEEVLAVPFVAPGRKRLFLERCWGPSVPEAPPVPCPPAAETAADPARAAELDRLLVAGRADDALALAREVLFDPSTSGAERPYWQERAAVAAWQTGLLDEAEGHLDAALGLAPNRASILLALSDLAFLRGDRGAERRLREAVYGSLAGDAP
jgi:hypothetical protein